MKHSISPHGALAVRTGLVCLMSAFQVVGGSAYAQSQSGSGQDASAEAMTSQEAFGDSIVVTAQRREERLVEVPVSVSAVGGDTLTDLGISQPTELQNIVPSLAIVDAGPIPKVGIRGVGLTDFGYANESPVAMYVNDVYIAPPVSPLAQLFDINRVEVLRGPQGTLFGRNATGGLIQIITNKPTADYSGGASFQYGSFDQVIIEGHQNIPLSDSVRTRIAGIYNRDDGWQSNPNSSERYAKTNSYNLRGTIEADLTDSITNTTIAHYGEKNNVSSIYAFRGTLDPVTGARCSDERIVDNECVTSDGFRNPNPNPREVYTSREDPRDYLETWGVGNTLVYSAPSFNLTSVTAYEGTTSLYEGDSGATANPIFIVSYGATREQFSQEFRADGETGNFTWVGGVYYFHDKLSDGFVTAPNAIAAFGTTVGLQNEYKQTTDSMAGFAQVDFAVTPSFTLTGGIRYTHEEKTLTISDDFSDPNFMESYSPESDRVTWRAGVNWDIQDNLMAYANVSTGFKSAAFNAVLVGPGQATPSAPEKNTNYEIGMKGETADRRLQGSIAAFYADYKDFQLITVPPSSGAVSASLLINIPGADIYGVEAEFAVRPIDGFSLSGNATVLDTKINAPGILVSSVSIDGDPLPTASEFSAKGIARYDLQTESMGTISPWLSGSYRTKFHGKSPATLLQEIPGYAIFDAGITWESPDESWKLDFLVQNLTDKAYYANATSFTGMSFIQFAKVRTFAVRATANW